MDSGNQNPVGSTSEDCMSILGHIYGIACGALRAVGFLVAAVVLWFLIGFGWMWTERTLWKSKALSRLATAERDDRMVQAELHSKAVPTSESDPRAWAGRHVIKMTNGEYLIYQYWHRSAGVADLFLARGSNGRWYSVNYHFCNEMTVARFTPQPLSIAEFASKYALSEFEGPAAVPVEPAKAR